MSGNRHRAGKGWPNYGKDRKRDPPADYKPRKRGPAQTPKRAVEETVEVSGEEEVAA